MRAKEFITESVHPHTIFNQVKDIHREFRDIEEGDLPDRIYWFDDYELTELPLSKIDLDEFYIDEGLIDEYIEHIKDSPSTMPPIVYDPIVGSVIDGMHRANAYARLGRKSIPAYIGKTKSSSYGEREEDLDEMALPADWDESMLGHDKTFKKRLEYVLQNAPRLGAGSSRLAVTIEDNDRPTVLKVAKNKKGIAQNIAELKILSHDRLSKHPIVIPLVDYDRKNPKPLWVQTELAQKIREPALCKLLKCKSLVQFIGYVRFILNRPTGLMWKNVPKVLEKSGYSEQDINTFYDYANEVADLVKSSSLIEEDFQFADNWGVYKGRPVIIDLGFDQSVYDLYESVPETQTNETTIKLGGLGPSEKTKEWVAKVNDMFPESPLSRNNRIMTFGEGNDMSIVQFELTPKHNNKVELKWIQATPLRSGSGTKAIKILQDLAQKDGIALTLYPWDKGQISQSKLMKFYKKTRIHTSWQVQEYDLGTKIG
jgi:hypothetical protein